MKNLDPPPFHRRVIVLERNRVYEVGAWLLLLAGWGYVCLGHSRISIFAATWCALIGARVVWKTWQNSRPRRRLADVQATAQGVLVDGFLQVQRMAILDGFYQPRREGNLRSSVRVVGRYRRVIFECEVDSEEHALSLLDVLDLSPEKRRAEFSAESLLLSSPPLLAFALLLCLGSIAASFGLFWYGLSLLRTYPLLPVSILCLMNALWLVMVPSTVCVGTDGVATRWLWQRSFIPMNDIVAVAAHGQGQISLRHVSGRYALLDISGNEKAGAAGRLARQKRDAVLARIVEAHRTVEAKGTPLYATLLLTKGRRDANEWLESLCRFAYVSHYRDGALPALVLWQVFENPSAPEDARAAALFLLRKTLDENGRSRVRLAADAAVSPKLRIALEAISGEDDSAHEEALLCLVG